MEPPPKISMMKFDGSAWEAMPDPIPEPPTAPFSPDMALLPQPEPFPFPKLVMATEINPEPYLMEPNIMFREYDGTEWSGPTSAPSFTALGINPTITYYEPDGLWLFWEDTSTTPPNIRYTGDAMLWSDYMWFDNGTQPTATVYNDELYLVWVRDDTLVYTIYNGTVWSTEDERGLINPQPWPIDPLIAVHNGLLHLVYESQSVYLHTFNGTTWHGPYPLKNYGTLSPSDPAIASFNGLLYFAYASNGDLYYQTLEGNPKTGEWSTPTKVPTPKPVGGIWTPVDKLALLAPYIALVSTILAATATTAIYVKHAKRRKKKQ